MGKCTSICIGCLFLLKFKWGKKNKVDTLSHNWNLLSDSRELTFGYCRVCNCYNYIFNLLCNRSGSGSGSGESHGCNCYGEKLT